MKSISLTTKSAKSIVAVRRKRIFLIPMHDANADIAGWIVYGNGNTVVSTGWVERIVDLIFGLQYGVVADASSNRAGWRSRNGFQNEQAGSEP